MTGLEAIPKISELLTRLIKLTKDRETGALVQQIQERQLEIHTALVVADVKGSVLSIDTIFRVVVQ